MSNENIVDIGRAVRDIAAQGQQIPADMAKMAIWRKGLPAPTTFVVEESEGRRVIQDWANGHGVFTFKTYSDGTGRRSETTMLASEVVGLTLEYATIQLVSAE